MAAERQIIIKLGISGTNEVTAQLEQIGQKGERSIGRITKASSLLGDSVRLLNPLLATLSVGAIAAFTRSVIDTVGGLGELAEQVGVGTKSLQALQFQAIQSGVSAEQMEAALIKLNRSIGEAAAGGDDAIGAFASLGVGILDASGNLRTTEEILQEVAVAIAALPTPAERARAAMEIFGKTGARFQTVLSEIAKVGLPEITRAAEEAGTVVDDALIKRFDELSDKAAVAGKQFVVFSAEVIDAIVRISNTSLQGYANLARFMGLLSKRPEDRLGELASEEAGLLDELFKVRSSTNVRNPDVRRAAENKVLEELKRVQAERDRILASQSLQKPPVEAPSLSPTGTTSNPKGNAQKEREAREARDAANRSAREAAQAARELDKQIDALGARLEPTTAATERYAAETELLDRALKANAISFEDYIRLMSELNEEFEKGESTQQRWNRMQEEGRQLVEQMKTPLEKFGDQMQRIAELEERGAVSAETAQRKRAQLREELSRQVDQQKDETDKLGDAARDIGLTFTSAFEDAIVSGKKFSDVLRAIGQDIAKLVLRKTVTEPATSWLSGLLRGGGILGGLFRGGGGGLFSGTGYDPSSTFFGAFPFADGGIMTPRGPVPMRSYARGGIADRPQMAYFGEGAMNEAYVPLPDGRSIPVVQRGGGGTVLNIDARGADAGVEGRIDKVIAKRMPEILRMTTANVARLSDKGGSFSRTVGRRGSSR